MNTPMVSATIKQNVGLDAASAFELIADPDAAVKFLDGVKSYELLDSNWNSVGARRRITLNNGTTILETIKVFKPFEHFTYELTDFNERFKLFLVRGTSQCWFVQTKTGTTQVTWRFTYQPRNLLLVPVLWIFMKLPYRRYMRAAALNIEHDIKSV